MVSISLLNMRNCCSLISTRDRCPSKLRCAAVLAKHGEPLSSEFWWKQLSHELALVTVVSMASISLQHMRNRYTLIGIRDCCPSKTKMSCCPGKGMGDCHPPQLVEIYHTFNKPLRLQSQWQVSSYEHLLTLTLFDMGRGHDGPPNGVFFITLPKRVGAGSQNMVTFNINLCCIKINYCWFPRPCSVTLVMSPSRSTQDFFKFHMFLTTKFWKFSKVK